MDCKKSRIRHIHVHRVYAISLCNTHDQAYVSLCTLRACCHVQRPKMISFSSVS